MRIVSKWLTKCQSHTSSDKINMQVTTQGDQSWVLTRKSISHEQKQNLMNHLGGPAVTPRI